MSMHTKGRARSMRKWARDLSESDRAVALAGLKIDLRKLQKAKDPAASHLQSKIDAIRKVQREG